MPMGELRAKEALRVASDWLNMSDAPGKDGAIDGIANAIPLVMMGEIEAENLDDLAASVLRCSSSSGSTDVQAAVNAAFAFVKSKSN